ncbi:pentatricopeptide repeat-containing protein At3g12770 [Typha angustifolia]|uniref:pentatricopeptide repeat-containing protein At3g12770 n=1 Tax=Typha angustifolia TaxID=59011 RepID=UPI003C2FDE2A
MLMPPPITAAAVHRVAALIDSATHPSHLLQLHAHLVLSGLHLSPFLATKFLHSFTLFSCSSLLLSHARNLFDEFPHPNIFLYNAAIRLHARHNSFTFALRFYRRMLSQSIRPDGFTFPSVLKACSGLPAPIVGRTVHAHVLRLGFLEEVFIQNGLIAMYVKCGDVDSARKMFDKMEEKNVVSWTSAISGYVQNGSPLEALRLFRMMRSTGSDVRPDFVVLVSVLKAYTDVDDLEHGKSVHGLVVKGGFDNELDLLVTLTAMYAKCGHVQIARSFFDQVTLPDVILWNAMISGYAKNGYAKEAVELFRRMIVRSVRPDSITIRSAILACAQVGSLEVARWMEDYTHCSEFEDDVFINTALIDMYAKCGSIAHAHAVFERIHDKDVVVWSAIIVGYGMHGCGSEAISLFEEMKRAGIRPNDVTFIGLLSACNHAGLVDEGWKYFHSMKDYGIMPRHQHFACVVDLLARAGRLEQAYEFVLDMPIEPEITVWGALLTACKIYGHVRLGEYAAKHIFCLEPSNAGHYVQLSNIYASAGMWNDVSKVRLMMKDKGVMKGIGCSSIEIDGELHSFRVGDKRHPRSKEIFTMADEMERKLKDSGFLPHLESVLLDLDINENEEFLCNQNEKMAIAFG